MPKHSHLTKAAAAAPAPSERRIGKTVAKPARKAKDAVVKVRVLNWPHAEALLKKKLNYNKEQVKEQITSGPFWVYNDDAPRDLVSVISGDWDLAARLNGARVQAKLADSKTKRAVVQFPDKMDAKK